MPTNTEIAQGTVKADGTVALTFQSPGLGQTWTGVVTVANAVGPETWRANVAGAYWGTFFGTGTFGVIQCSGGEQVSITAAGLTPGAQFQATYIFFVLPTDKAPPAFPQPVPSGSIALGGGTNITNAVWGQASTAKFAGSGSPIGVVTPSGIGDLYVDDVSPAMWQATGPANTNWVQIAAGGSIGLVLIQRQVLSAPAANVDFANIPQIYENLVLECLVASALNNVNDNLVMQLNGDAGAHYNYDYLNLSQSAGAQFFDSANATFAILGDIEASNSTNRASTLRLMIPAYRRTTFTKSYRSESGGIANLIGGGVDQQLWGEWTSTAAITDLKVFSPNANLVAGSVFSLYAET